MKANFVLFFFNDYLPKRDPLYFPFSFDGNCVCI